MYLNSISIYGTNGEKLTILLTDSIFDVLAKVETIFNTTLIAEMYNDIYETEEENNSDTHKFSVLRLESLPLYYYDTTLNILFNEGGYFMGIDVASYLPEHDVTILNLVDEMGNSDTVDFNPNDLCKLADEHFSVVDLSEKEDTAYIDRGYIESIIGDLIFVYPDMSEPFTTLSLVRKSYADKARYKIGGKNLFTEQPDSDGNILY